MRIAMQYARLSKLFTDQGINVIFATISMFDQLEHGIEKI